MPRIESTVCAAVASLVIAASPALAGAQNAPFDRVFAGTCRADTRLAGAAEWALEHRDALDGAQLRDLVEAAGLSAASVRAWVGRGSADGAAQVASAWLARQSLDSGSARCHWASRGNVFTVLAVPRWIDPANAATTVRVGDSLEYSPRAASGATGWTLVVLRPDGRAERTATEPNAAVHFDAPGVWSMQLLGDTPGGPMPFATWHVRAAPSGDAIVTAPSPAGPVVEGPSDARSLFVSINRDRSLAGQPALRPDPLLASVADERAHELASIDRVAHALTASDGPGERLLRAGLAADRLAENVARAPSVAAADRRLDGSPSHRANRLDPGVDALGVGVARRGNVVFVVEMFALRPRMRGP